MRRVVFALGLSTACAPSFEDQPYLLDGPRLIAVVAEPPEARPREEVVLTPTIAGGRLSKPLRFRFCTNAPLLDDPRSASDSCREEPGIPLETDGRRARGALPADACARFGPDPVGSDFQPRDADATGGFYQPVIVEGAETSVALVRVVCPLPDAPVQLARELQRRYVPNQNPKGLRLEQASGDGWQPLTSVRPGESTSVRVAWDEAAQEPYVWLPPDGSALAERQEVLEFSWFVSSGTLARATTDGARASENVITAPAEVATVDLWVVVHDDRGGTAVLSASLAVSTTTP